MRTVDYSALATAAPVNKDAALARDGQGISYTSALPPNKVSKLHSDLPLPMAKAPEVAHDWTGATWGLFRVLGLYAEDALKTGVNARWVVRCVCGRYETRRAKALAITPRDGGGDRCADCDRTNVLRKRANPSLMVRD